MDWSEYYTNLFKMLAMQYLPPLLKTGIFYFIFRLTKCNTSFLLCFLLAFIPAIALNYLPIHLSAVWSFIAVVIFGIIYLYYFSEVDLFPAGLTILIAAEAIIRVLQKYVF